VNNSLSEIYNFLDLSTVDNSVAVPRLATSGQPTIAQLPQIKAAGYQVVINLALLDSSNAVAAERSILEDLGLTYIHLPVSWESPKVVDFELFVQTLQKYQGQSIYIHCAANKRVAVFVYLYRRIYEKMSAALALADLEKIWTPNPIWQIYMDELIQEKLG
jgi:protein tyrosine phosphatase (PTP) superfamily phosphohydrolase (DUF442 family)